MLCRFSTTTPCVCVYVLREQVTQLLVMVTTGLILDTEMLVPY